MSTDKVGDYLAVRGFFTTQLHLQGHSLQEIEHRLGFATGRLSRGAWFITPTRLPLANEFDFAGYSQVAGHHTQEQYGALNSTTGAGETDAMKIKKRSVIAGWSLFGTSRLIKVLPEIEHSNYLGDDYQYPPGTGIPQWKITNAIECRRMSFVRDYINGRFIPDQGYTEVKYK